MSTNEKKVIKHRILDKHPIVGIILLTVLALFMIQGFIGGVLGVGIALVLGLPQEPILYISMVVSAFIMLAIHKRWFYPEYEGSISFDNRFGKWLIVTIAILLALIIPDFIIMTVTGTNFVAPSIKSILVALVAGTTEETIFRGIPASYAMRHFNDRKKLPLVIGITSLLFSLIHATNIFAGASVSATLLQLLTSFGIGTTLCALYFRSGNIILPMLLHFLYDVYALMNADSVTEAGVLDASLTVKDLTANLIILVIEIAITLYLLRGPVLDDLTEIWKKKWNK
ncbi:CAAX amino terminal protease family protein [Butyrivibrio proteoclasticus B316]|uniref:CAAX amino terminal protease family protein n=1 Tax=Butyrivibrio proteoclasticus (strain ATCC 51982 / DSM 14932 / B316) TaxID=515622 RepID=E0RV98_BUTPB|nr:type II CAAX endopeptidase family protein [Butyrivibrio proteoclasticus]ADL34517.1 CAAX amino terminal protease family protein [Butyrivibrio proteoclasticus B316]